MIEGQVLYVSYTHIYTYTTNNIVLSYSINVVYKYNGAFLSYTAKSYNTYIKLASI